MALKLIGKPPVIRPPKAQVINVKTKKLLRKAQTAYQLKPQRLLDVVYPYGVEGINLYCVRRPLLHDDVASLDNACCESLRCFQMIQFGPSWPTGETSITLSATS